MALIRIEYGSGAADLPAHSRISARLYCLVRVNGNNITDQKNLIQIVSHTAGLNTDVILSNETIFICHRNCMKCKRYSVSKIYM